MMSSEEQRGQVVGGSEEKSLVNLSRQYQYKVMEMMGTGGADWLVKSGKHVYGRQKPAKGTTNGQDA